MKFVYISLASLLAPFALRAESPTLAEQCFTSLKSLPGKTKNDELHLACSRVQALDACESEKGVKIFHFDVPAKAGEAAPKKILVFSLIHGDELPSGSVARSWMERLTKVEPRNSWRVVPVLNPDGMKNRTRLNGNGVDVNRNFPTANWEKEALAHWESKMKKDPRRFPGKSPNSEKETRCAMAHIDAFQPDLILSVHTPYNVLDFDGPKIMPPKFSRIPWKSLGNYPGSMGRYMWVDRSKPILTIELGSGKNVVEKLDEFDRLQDISGDIAIMSEKMLKEKDKAKQPKQASKGKVKPE